MRISDITTAAEVQLEDAIKRSHESAGFDGVTVNIAYTKKPSLEIRSTYAFAKGETVEEDE